MRERKEKGEEGRETERERERYVWRTECSSVSNVVVSADIEIDQLVQSRVFY